MIGEQSNPFMGRIAIGMTPAQKVTVVFGGVGAVQGDAVCNDEDMLIVVGTVVGERSGRAGHPPPDRTYLINPAAVAYVRLDPSGEVV